MGRRLDSGPTPMPRRRAARRGYWTDLSEAQWAVIAPLVPDARAWRASAEGVLARTRQRDPLCLAGRVLVAASPCRLPALATVYYYLQRWRRAGVWARI